MPSVFQAAVLVVFTGVATVRAGEDLLSDNLVNGDGSEDLDMQQEIEQEMQVLLKGQHRYVELLANYVNAGKLRHLLMCSIKSLQHKLSERTSAEPSLQETIQKISALKDQSERMSNVLPGNSVLAPNSVVEPLVYRQVSPDVSSEDQMDIQDMEPQVKPFDVPVMQPKRKPNYEADMITLWTKDKQWNLFDNVQEPVSPWIKDFRDQDFDKDFREAYRVATVSSFVQRGDQQQSSVSDTVSIKTVLDHLMQVEERLNVSEDKDEKQNLKNRQQELTELTIQKHFLETKSSIQQQLDQQDQIGNDLLQKRQSLEHLLEQYAEVGQQSTSTLANSLMEVDVQISECTTKKQTLQQDKSQKEEPEKEWHKLKADLKKVEDAFGNANQDEVVVMHSMQAVIEHVNVNSQHTDNLNAVDSKERQELNNRCQELRKRIFFFEAKLVLQIKIDLRTVPEEQKENLRQELLEIELEEAQWLEQNARQHNAKLMAEFTQAKKLVDLLFFEVQALGQNIKLGHKVSNKKEDDGPYVKIDYEVYETKLDLWTQHKLTREEVNIIAEQNKKLKFWCERGYSVAGVLWFVTQVTKEVSNILNDQSLREKLAVLSREMELENKQLKETMNSKFGSSEPKDSELQKSSLSPKNEREIQTSFEMVVDKFCQQSVDNFLQQFGSQEGAPLEERKKQVQKSFRAFRDAVIEFMTTDVSIVAEQMTKFISVVDNISDYKSEGKLTKGNVGFLDSIPSMFDIATSVSKLHDVQSQFSFAWADMFTQNAKNENIREAHLVQSLEKKLRKEEKKKDVEKIKKAREEFQTAKRKDAFAALTTVVYGLNYEEMLPVYNEGKTIWDLAVADIQKVMPEVKQLAQSSLQNEFLPEQQVVLADFKNNIPTDAIEFLLQTVQKQIDENDNIVSLLEKDGMRRTSQQTLEQRKHEFVKKYNLHQKFEESRTGIESFFADDKIFMKPLRYESDDSSHESAESSSATAVNY